MTIVHAVTTTQADYGGPSRSVPQLCVALADNGSNVRLLTSVLSGASKSHEPILPRSPVEVSIVGRHDTPLHTILRPLNFYRELRHIASRSTIDIIHDHGIWLPTHASVALAGYRYDIPLVISTRGMLTPWALQHQRLKKQVAWWIYQRHVLEQASLLHVTSEEEAEILRALGFEQPIAIIPNGVEIPAEPARSTRREGSTALFLSRLHPKKGLPMLIDAWANISPRDWTLMLVGPNENGHREALREQVERNGLGSTVTFVGPVSDDEKWSYYRQADLFVLPTHSENFGIVVAEALASGTPVITTTGAPWEELHTHNCGWWVEPKCEAIATALEKAISCSLEELQSMGKCGQKLVRERYSWGGVAKQMLQAYEWLVKGGAPPECINFH